MPFYLLFLDPDYFFKTALWLIESHSCSVFNPVFLIICCVPVLQCILAFSQSPYLCYCFSHFLSLLTLRFDTVSGDSDSPLSKP